MNKALLLCLSLFLVALSGCTDDGGAADDLKDEFERQNEEQAGEEPENGEGNEEGEPEMGTLVLNAAAPEAIGNAPFTANIDIAGKALNPDGTEGDNGTIEWAIFDADENSTSGIEESGLGLPANLNVTFTEVGNFSLAIGAQLEGYDSAFQVLNFTVLPVDEELPTTVPETWNLIWIGDKELSKSQASEMGKYSGDAIVGLALDYTYSWVATEASNGFPAGANVNGAFNIATTGPNVRTGYSVTLFANGSEVGSMSDATTGISMGPISLAFDFTAAEIPAEANLTLDINIDSLGQHFIDPSSFTIS